MVGSKQPIIAMLEDDSVDYDEIKEALLSRNIMSHAAAAKAYYSLDSKELLNLPMAQAFSKLDRWLVKMGEGAETGVEKRKICYGANEISISARAQVLP